MLRVIAYPFLLLWRLPAFIVRMLGDALRVIGSVMMVLLLAPMVLLSVALGRWSASSHYGRAVAGEVGGALLSFYRLVLGHILWLFRLTPLTEAIEQRLPRIVKMAPGADRPARSQTAFEGYRIVGSLSSGGSGSKLYIAEPSDEKVQQFQRDGHEGVEEVVIKTFNLHDGSSLPQIVRESRALDAAKRLDLVLEHSLTDDRFFYVMRYVPGDSLTEATQQLHARSGPQGLEGDALRAGLSHVADLLRTLDGYHRGGLWHKDVKPDNIIVSQGRAHLVDLGLVTPLRSAMTLTTHGTEYFRDPEMVRMALRGVKVHEVDGARFDVFAAGAVMYSVIENSFPAHGGLSNISKRTPDTVRWIVRRAMADYDKRYKSAAEMLADLRVLLEASDPFRVKPRDLPSVSGDTAVAEPRPEPVEVVMPRPPAQAPRPRTPMPAAGGLPPRSGPGRMMPALGVVNWWTGAYRVESVQMADGPAPRERMARQVRVGPVRLGMEVDIKRTGRERPRVAAAMDGPSARIVPIEQRRSSREQRAAARARVIAAQRRAHQFRSKAMPQQSGHERGLGAALLTGVSCIGLVGGMVYLGITRAGSAEPTLVQAEPQAVERPVVPFDQFKLREDILPQLPSATAVLSAGVLPTLNDPVGSARFAVEVGGVGVAAIQRMLASGTFLVIQDPAVRDVEGVEREVGGVVARLRAAGFKIAGHPGDESIERDMLEQLVAEVYEQRGVRSLSSRSVKDDLGRWLKDEPRFNWILWIERDPDERNGLGMHMFNAAQPVGSTVLDRALPAAQRAFAEAVVFDSIRGG